MKESEDYIRNFSDGYIYKDDGSWMKDKVRNSSSPSLKIYPCPPLAYLKEPKEPEKNAVIKLVYAGQVSHERQSKKIFGDMYYIPVIKDLTNQGFHVTVYNAVQNTRRHPLELYQEYLDEADNSDLFEFKSGIPMPDILDELHGKYHFGLIAYYFEDDLHVGKDHIKGTMASKLFTYLASGMPVIVSDQFEYMAKIVESEGIGIVVARNDLQNLARLLDSFDYQEMLDNVLLAQQKYNIDSKIPEIMELLEA
jgi:glycosyltransferase involved in cell wall biosynthesis